MKCLKLHLYQETACYKKPFAFKVAETYPLPPYSTIKGMMHKLLNADRFIDMSVSVQGTYESIFNNYVTFYSFKSDNEKPSKFPLNVLLLYNVELIIHVYSHEPILERILEALRSTNETISLGRAEDLVVLKRADFVDFQKVSIDDLEDELRFLKNSFYIPTFYNAVDKGVFYKIPYKYQIINGIRTWEELVDVYHVQKGTFLNSATAYIDNENDLIFFHKEPESLTSS
ncbi:type I-B CRISPR-associated protein Cas5b [Fervidobacterium islandicum]|uniref:Type I-B CRISPR-associated protein Cas5b n=1 Tax=Fervidobacterium islandicum TaxID=2423 RepID=A0AAI8GDL2_FERIS|nr:type I-B CRISPR-associated protein Cas5b [Fervidobacterium islandicum]AMW33136.1 type I-B CRISPR-associated protein Cas5b [Fervidobacterium islandicum]